MRVSECKLNFWIYKWIELLPPEDLARVLAAVLRLHDEVPDVCFICALNNVYDSYFEVKMMMQWKERRIEMHKYN